MSVHPEISEALCLNERASSQAGCTRCSDICPSKAIHLEQNIPQLDDAACTGCLACTSVCPINAISQEQIDPRTIVGRAREVAQQGRSKLYATCAAVTDGASDLRVPCHALWDAFLLASVAAEGIRDIHIVGTDRCDACPVRHGADCFAQTRQDYDTLNMALEVRLNIRHDAPPAPKPDPQQEERPGLREPSRRAFFRNLLPSIAQGVAMTAAQIGQAAREELSKQEKQEDADHLLPLRHRLFLQALPRLRPNFTPVPDLPSLPMGAVQATDACTACNKCVEGCPTHALALKPFGGNRVLEFRPDACIGCRHCVGACPESAIEMLPGISLPAIAAGRSRPLIMVPVKGKTPTANRD